jgi:hypothetical protein
MCGHDTQTQLDSGEWICRDCVEKIGGYKHWFEIKTLPAEQIIYMMGQTENPQPESPEKSETDSIEKSQGCVVRFLKLVFAGVTGFLIVMAIILVPSYFQSKKQASEIRSTVEKAIITEAPTPSPTPAPTSTRTPRPTKVPKDGVDRYVSASDVRLLESMGLSEVHVMDVRKPNDKMSVMLARIFDDQTMQLNITTENGKIIYVQLTGIKADVLSMSSKWNGKAEVDMYSDTEGGVMATLNWQNRSMKIIKNSKY